MTRVERIRADELVVRQGLAPSRSRAKVLIMAGEIMTADRRVEKPAEQLPTDAVLSLKNKPRYVSRGGLKLEAALEAFDIDVSGLVAADIGASTGGFTDCLLQAGARRVFAVDVGYGQLDYTLREDPRVVVMERQNARYLEPLDEPMDIIVVDVSFISLKLVLPALVKSLADNGSIVALVKPQFEAGRGVVNRQGVVRDDRVRRRVVREIIDFSTTLDLGYAGLIRSPLKGPAGNEEFLLHLRHGWTTDRDCVARDLQMVFGEST